jgi:hypothetical protein
MTCNSEVIHMPYIRSGLNRLTPLSSHATYRALDVYDVAQSRW